MIIGSGVSLVSALMKQSADERLSDAVELFNQRLALTAPQLMAQPIATF